MRQILVFAAICLVLGAGLPKLLERVGAQGGSAPPAIAAAADPAPSPTAYRSVTVEPDRQGHFRLEGQIDGRRLDFMVDTGASVIALTANDAARLGLRPLVNDFTVPVRTANGVIKAAPTQLDRVEVGGLTVRDVQALILPDEALSENLLGLSFLSRLRRFAYANGRLVLEQ